MSDATEPETIPPPGVEASPESESAVAAGDLPPELPATAPGPPGSWATLWLTDRDVAAFAALAVVVLVLLAARWAQLSGWGLREVEIERLSPVEHVYRLDVNEATWVEFAQLDGIGETLAMRIVEDRETNGPFRSVEDLDRVKGIGPKTLERLRPYLRGSSPGDPE
ncbi:MAG TPA: helix-hairpin-helix domain-containing protein [Planctomycetaceae bacterium]